MLIEQNFAAAANAYNVRMRIASLIPSATEIVCALGLNQSLVGVTHECDFPPEVRTLSKITRTLIPVDAPSDEIDRLVSAQRGGARALYALEADRLAELQPDLIITQTLCDVCAVDDREVKAFVDAASSIRSKPRVLYLEPTRFEHVLEDVQRVADAAGEPGRGHALRNQLDVRVARLRDRCADFVRSAPGTPRVVVLEWLVPMFSCGHWTPDLVELAGANEPLARGGERSRRINVQELVAADPDMILIACCGYSLERTLADIATWLEQPELGALRAVQTRRVYACDGSAYFSRPGPRLVESLEILAAALWQAPDLLSAGVPAAQAAPLGHVFAV